jgi:hypothetical protein
MSQHFFFAVLVVFAVQNAGNLSRFFGLSNDDWLRAQAAHDTEVAERALGSEILRIKPWAA